MSRVGLYLFPIQTDTPLVLRYLRSKFITFKLKIMYPVSISTASGSKFKPNKHNVLPVILTPIQGSLPANAGILDGTLAERLGLKSGFRYILNIQFVQMNKVGDKQYQQYAYSIVSCLGQDFDKMVAEKLVGAMSFDFNFGAPAPAPVSVPITTSTSVPAPISTSVPIETITSVEEVETT